MIHVPIEVSARHIHLKAEDQQKLFGDQELKVAKSISQHPQFVAEQRVTLSGPKGQLQRVGIVGPQRDYTQVELAPSDARQLGIQPPVTDSGHLDEAAEITIAGLVGSITIPAAIIQRRHLHISKREAADHGLTDRQDVGLQVDGQRGGTLDHVLVRIHPDFSMRIHLDTDEANALGIRSDQHGTLIIS